MFRSEYENHHQPELKGSPWAGAALWAALAMSLVSGWPMPATLAQAPRVRAARDLASPDIKKQLDLRVSKLEALTASPFMPGQEVQYRVEFTNEGPHDSPDTLVRVVLPEALLGAAWSCQPVPALGSLRLKQTFTNGAEVASGLFGAAGLAFEPTSGTLWVASAFDATLMQFGKDASGSAWRAMRIISGRDTAVRSMNGASGIWISPDGADLYLTGSIDNAITQFRLEREVGAETSGTVTPRLVHVLKQDIEGVDGLVGATNLVGDVRGDFVYVAAPVSQAITTFRRDPARGRLTYVGKLTNTEVGRNALAGVNSLALSTDGRFLYAASYLDHTVLVCERNPGDGLLKVAQVISRADDPTLPLDEPYALALSPKDGGRHLYVAAFSSDALLVYRRDDKTGRLELIQTIHNDADGVTSLDGPCAVALSPDGVDLVVACQFSSTVMEFRRDALTGKLQPVGEQKEGQASVMGLSGASGLAFSPNGETLAAAAGESSALHLFQKVKYMPQLSGGGDVRARVDLSAGAKLIYTIHGQTSPLGDPEMELRALIDGGAALEDLDPSNNFGKRSDLVQRPKPDLQLEIQEPPTSVPAGSDFEVKMLVTNRGTQDALGLRLDLPLPPGVLGVAWEADSRPAVTELRGDNRLVPPARPDPNEKVEETPRESIAIDPDEDSRKAAEKAHRDAQIDPALTWLDARQLIASPDGRHVYALCGNPARFVIFQRDLSSGAIGPVSVFPQQEEKLASLLMTDISRLVFTPEGEGLYALNPKTGAVILFRRDPLKGTLTLANLWRKTDKRLEALQDAADIAITPNGRHLLIYQAQGARLLRISLLPSRPGMVLWQSAPPIELTSPDFAPDASAASPIAVSSPVMAVARGGKIVYLSNPALGGVAAFQLPDLDNPTAEPVARALAPVAGPRRTANLLLSPDERHLYAFERSSGTLHTLSCDSATGALRPGVGAPIQLVSDIERLGNIDQPLAFLAEGRTLLLPREFEPGRFALFTALRDPATGYLEISDRPVNHVSEDKPSPGFAALGVSKDFKDVYTLRRDDFTVQHLRDLRPAHLPHGLGRLSTRLTLPAGSHILYRAQLRLSPTFRAAQTALEPRVGYDSASPGPETAAKVEIAVTHPSQARVKLRLLDPPLEPGLPARFEVSVRNELINPLLDGSLASTLKGHLSGVRWRSLEPPSLGQWQELASQPMRPADAEGKAVDFAVSPDERRLFVLEDAPAKLRVFEITPGTFALAERPSSLLEDSIPDFNSQFTQLAVGLNGQFVYILDEPGLAIHIYALAPGGAFILAGKHFLPTDLGTVPSDQLMPGPLRLDWDESAQALTLWRDNGAGDAIVNARYSVSDVDGGLTNLRVPPDATFPAPTVSSDELMMSVTRDGLIRFALSADGQSLLTQRHSVSQFTAEGAGDLQTALELDGKCEVTFQLEGQLAAEALGFVWLNAKLEQKAPSGTTLLHDAAERWRLSPIADLKATLVAQGPSRQGEPTSMLLTLRNDGPSQANAIWLHDVTAGGWKPATLEGHVTLPQRIPSLAVGQEVTFKLAYTPSEYLRPAGQEASAPLPLPPLQEARVELRPATDLLEPANKLFSFAYPRPRLTWSHYGPDWIARRELIPIDAYLDLPVDSPSPVIVHLQGPADWTWVKAHLAPSGEGDLPWLAELQPADQALHPGRAKVLLTRNPAVSPKESSLLRLVLSGKLSGLGAYPLNQPEPAVRLSAAIEYTDTLYGLATSAATPGSLHFQVGRPNPSVLITDRLDRPGTDGATLDMVASIPLVVRNLASQGAAPLVDFELRPETPGGWRWTGAETEDARLHTPETVDQTTPLTVRVSHLPPGESAVVWLHAERIETGGDVAPAK